MAVCKKFLCVLQALFSDLVLLLHVLPLSLMLAERFCKICPSFPPWSWGCTRQFYFTQPPLRPSPSFPPWSLWWGWGCCLLHQQLVKLHITPSSKGPGQLFTQRPRSKKIQGPRTKDLEPRSKDHLQLRRLCIYHPFPVSVQKICIELCRDVRNYKDICV